MPNSFDDENSFYNFVERTTGKSFEDVVNGSLADVFDSLTKNIPNLQYKSDPTIERAGSVVHDRVISPDQSDADYEAAVKSLSEIARKYSAG